MNQFATIRRAQRLSVPEKTAILFLCLGEERGSKLMQELAPIVGGRGGGKPEMARGAGNDPSKVPDLLEKARELL